MIKTINHKDKFEIDNNIFEVIDFNIEVLQSGTGYIANIQLQNTENEKDLYWKSVSEFINSKPKFLK